MTSSARLAALPSDKCDKCGAPKMYHCIFTETDMDYDHKMMCNLEHHEFVEKPEPVMSHARMVELLDYRIKALEFDIACLQRVKDGWKRNGKAIRDLKNAITGYEQQREKLTIEG